MQKPKKFKRPPGVQFNVVDGVHAIPGQFAMINGQERRVYPVRPAIWMPDGSTAYYGT